MSVHTMKHNSRLTGFLFAAPALLIVVGFFFLPLVYTFWISLHDWTLFGKGGYVGLKNYSRAFTDPQFHQSLYFTLKYTAVITPILVVGAFFLAKLVQWPRPGVGFFRSAFFLPFVVGLPAASYLWLWMFDDTIGIFNHLLRSAELLDGSYLWLSTENGALAAIVVSIVWKTIGFSMILILAGLNGISSDIYDAAALDNARGYKFNWYVALPMLRSTLVMVMVFSVIGSILAFDQFFIMTQGGPQNKTVTLVQWIYTNSFTRFKLGYGAALSVILLALLLVLSIVQIRLLRDK
jgi:multiple sugar transport system permease protein